MQSGSMYYFPPRHLFFQTNCSLLVFLFFFGVLNKKPHFLITGKLYAQE
jgi:hypothetical protein